MNVNEIKEYAKRICTDAFKMDIDEWAKKYFSPFGVGMTVDEAMLLDYLLNVFLSYKLGTYTFDEAQTLVKGYVSEFKGGCNNV